MKKSWMVGAAAASAVVLVSAAFVLFPASRSTAQVGLPSGGQPVINADGCTCSRATLNGLGREQLATYHCVCPGTQCVITATQSSATMPPNVAQSCR